jgi:hypothetical protein
LQCEAGHVVYMALLGSRAVTIKESLDQVIETLYLIMNFFLLFVMKLIHFLITFGTSNRAFFFPVEIRT